MQNIKLLDCTLRDGGYVNNWEFGKNVISRIVEKVLLSGIDIVECGYLSQKNAGADDTARFNSIDDIRRAYMPVKSDNQQYAVMINFGEYPAGCLPDAPQDSPILRVAFHKKDMDKAFLYFEKLQEKGYKYFVQPMGALNYTDEEYVQLIHRTNALSAEAFYIVDSFGVMEMKDFRRLLFLADNNLDANIQLGYHAHNNLQQAYSNAKYMVEQNLEHDLIIDASVFGMGRGAGNLNAELFAKYLNQNHGKSYNIEPLLEVFDECLKPIFIHSFWGYSLPFYLSSIHNCHPNYAMFFSEKNTLSIKSMHELLQMISEEDKTSFTKEKATEYYNKYQENYIDDSASLKELSNLLHNRNILILAPGKTIATYEEKIKFHIKENNPIIIGVNRVSEAYNYDFLFASNEKRLTEAKPNNVRRFIKTSNLHKILDDTILLNYASYVCSNEIVSEDPTLMLLNVLISIGIHKITIAGFDGFSTNPDENYFAKGLSLGSNVSSKMKKNEAIRTELKKITEKTNLTFLTPSKYV